MIPLGIIGFILGLYWVYIGVILGLYWGSRIYIEVVLGLYWAFFPFTSQGNVLFLFKDWRKSLASNKKPGKAKWVPVFQNDLSADNKK